MSFQPLVLSRVEDRGLGKNSTITLPTGMSGKSLRICWLSQWLGPATWMSGLRARDPIQVCGTFLCSEDSSHHKFHRTPIKRHRRDDIRLIASQLKQNKSEMLYLRVTNSIFWVSEKGPKYSVFHIKRLFLFSQCFLYVWHIHCLKV